MALIVTGRSTSLETWTFLGDFLGPTVDDEIRAWNLTPHSGVWFFTNLPSGIRKCAPRRLGLDFLDSSSSLTLFGPSTSPHPFLAVQPLAVSAPFTVPHRSDLPGQRPKTKSPSPHSLLALLYLALEKLIVFFVLLSFCTKEPDGPGKPTGLRNGYLLRRGASDTLALKRHRTTNLDTGPEDGPLQRAGAPHGGPFTCVSPLVTPRPRLRHRTTCRAGSCNLPAGILQTPPPRFAENPTGLLRENFFRLRPSPPPSCHKNEKQQRRSKIRRTQKVVRPDNCSIPVEEIPPYLTGKLETKILPSVRACGGASSVSGDGVPATRIYPQLGDGRNHRAPFIMEPSNPPPALGVGPHRTHDPTSRTPSQLHTFTLELHVHL
ncbi:hypothetical protein GEV33_001753 [Tenebrio molitor]|uniref:Uncharacterized protein n=1 Tax=Tenebrio molitor TaxID=7067 RepID=A0A8J6HUE5_TENMO|nr:hypothetical protein GEV33_001753 [Tenebrio molitor]